MKISAVKVVVKENDLLTILRDYVKVDGLSFEGVEINEFITIKGNFRKGMDIPFMATMGIGNVIENKVNVRIFKVKALIPILDSVKNIAMKAFLKGFEDVGIQVWKDTLILDLNTIAKLVPYVYFKLKKVNAADHALEVEVEDVIYAENKETVPFKKKREDKKVAVEDCYNKFRNDVNEKIPEKYENIVEYAMIIPDITALLYRLFRDKRVSVKTKVMIGGILGYLCAPIDILPDFIPFVGKMDDVAIAFFGLNAIMNEVPEEVILSNWQGKDDVVLIVKRAVNYIYKAVGSQNVAKFIEFIKGLAYSSKKEEVETNESCGDIH